MKTFLAALAVTATIAANALPSEALPKHKQTCTEISTAQDAQIKVGMSAAKVDKLIGTTQCNARGQRSYWVPSLSRYLGIVIEAGTVTRVIREMPAG